MTRKFQLNWTVVVTEFRIEFSKYIFVLCVLYGRNQFLQALGPEVYSASNRNEYQKQENNVSAE
jgi:hypothetical protein